MSTKKQKVTVKDKDGNIIKIYGSKNECFKDTGIKSYLLNDKFMNNEPIDGLYYCLDERLDNYTKLICDGCGKAFYRVNNQVKETEKVYCSSECMVKNVTHQNNCKCPICGKGFFRDSWAISHSNNNYCSEKCASKAKRILYKGRKLSHTIIIKINDDKHLNGHKYIESDENHPYAILTNFGYMIPEEVMVVEKFLLDDNNSVRLNNNTHLSKGYLIAHKNFILDDNDVDNLIVLETNDYVTKLNTITNNYFEFKTYCQNNNLDYRTTYSKYLFNRENFKKANDGSGWW